MNNRMPAPVCSIDGCANEAHARGWCPNHYYSWRKHGDPLAIERIKLKPLPICKADDCDNSVLGGGRGWCKMHYTRWLRHGDPDARFPGLRESARLTYSSFHRRIRKTRGRAAEYECTHCGRQASQWAYIHGGDRRNVADYMPLCVPCHSTYDRAEYWSPEVLERWRRSVATAWTPEKRTRHGQDIRERVARERAAREA